MDGDDVLLPGSFSHLFGILDAHRALGAAAGSILLWDPETDRRIPSYYPPRLAYGLSRNPTLFGIANVAVNLYPSVGATLIKTEAARLAGGFPDSDFLETWAFGVSLALSAPVALSRRYCKLYRVSDEASLKNRGWGDWRASWTGRRELRHRARRHFGPAWGGALLTAAVLPAHLVEAIAETWTSAPRYTKMFRE